MIKRNISKYWVIWVVNIVVVLINIIALLNYEINMKIAILISFLGWSNRVYYAFHCCTPSLSFWSTCVCVCVCVWSFSRSSGSEIVVGYSTTIKYIIQSSCHNGDNGESKLATDLYTVVSIKPGDQVSSELITCDATFMIPRHAFLEMGANSNC